MIMQLSDSQVEQLFQFTEKKGVRWYDLQSELVDHLASRIEEEMSADNKLSFDAALQKVYKEFGIFGFAKIVQQKSEQLYRSARRIWWNAIASFFKLPNFILMVLVIAVTWQLARVVNIGILMIALITAEFITSVWLVRRMSRVHRRKRKLMILQSGTGYSSGFMFLYQMILFSKYDAASPLLFCILATLAFMTKYANFYVFDRVKAQAMKLYPE